MRKGLCGQAGQSEGQGQRGHLHPGNFVGAIQLVGIGAPRKAAQGKAVFVLRLLKAGCEE